LLRGLAPYFTDLSRVTAPSALFAKFSPRAVFDLLCKDGGAPLQRGRHLQSTLKRSGQDAW
jgi:hypothetical protein